MDSWIMEEMQTADLRDKRLERRLNRLLDSLSKSSTASIPAACNDRAEMVAAYRFFDNEKVEFENVLEPHIDATCERVARQKVALLVQDTTELDLTRPSSQMQGTGPLHQGKRCGALLHPLIAFTTDGTPLGTAYAEAWSREARPKQSINKRRVACNQKPLSEKETYRWLLAAEQCQTIKAGCPETQLIMVADRESDITEVIDYCNSQDDFDWVIRGGVDRIISKSKQSEASVKVRDQLLAGKIRLEKQMSIRSRVSWGSASLKQHPSQADRDAREITCTVHAAKVSLNDPRRNPSERTPDGVSVNAVLVSEVDPPEGVQSVEWLLLTSLPIRSKKQIESIIDHYEKRWVIELYFKVLKSGCRIESRRFEHMDRFLPALALYMIIAWRSLYVCRLSRTHKDSSCELVYEKSEWQSVWQIVKRCPPPERPPGLLEMTKIIAELGGYVNRQRAGPPGPQSMWLGLQRMHDFATCWNTFGPGAKTCV
jgi:IS4 transposase